MALPARSFLGTCAVSRGLCLSLSPPPRARPVRREWRLCLSLATRRGGKEQFVDSVIPPYPFKSEAQSFASRGDKANSLANQKHVSTRWKDYLPIGQRMPETRFIAFKVPLQKSFEVNLAPEECFSPLDLFNKIQEQNEELGLIIDLTYTQHYCKSEDLPETVSYLKICTVGHQVSDNNTIFKFKRAVSRFLKENKDNDKLIGVHCTHGLNRTGYLICK